MGGVKRQTMEYGDNYSSAPKDVSDSVSEKPILDLKLKGNDLLKRGDIEGAISAYREAIALAVALL